MVKYVFFLSVLEKKKTAGILEGHPEKGEVRPQRKGEEKDRCLF